jgi:UbiD family decarboxylase
MAYRDLREYLKVLEAKGKLHPIDAEVDKDWEIAAVCRRVFQRIPKKERPALKFNRVKGFSAPLVIGVIGASKEIYALALGTTPEKIIDTWFYGMEHPIEPRIVDKGPCQENVLKGEDVDWGLFPIPTWTVEHDPGPYITAPYVCTKDPETGIRNVGTYRIQTKGKNRGGFYAGKEQHIMLHLDKWEARGKPTPLAIVIGADPVIGAASVAKIPYGYDEFRMVGGIRGEPVELVKCLTVPLEVPATAEIVIEGEIPPGAREKEGPFGEYTGYMGVWGNHPVFDVKCITYRNNYIYQAFFSQMPPSESSCVRGIGRELPLLRHLRNNYRLPVKDLSFTESGASGATLLISMKKEYPGQVRQVAAAAWGAGPGYSKFTIIVDDDVDIEDSFSIQRAISSTVRPDRDVQIMDHMPTVGLDPSQAASDVPQHDPVRRVSSKILIDATRKDGFNPISVPPKEHASVLQLNREGILLNQLRSLGLQVKDVHLSESGGNSGILVISMTKQFPGQVNQIINAAWGFAKDLGKVTIVVDDDVDIRDNFFLEWAMSFRVQPVKDCSIIREMPALALDPLQGAPGVPPNDPLLRVTSRLAIDATRKHAFPPLALPPKEHLDYVDKNWKKYGFR